MPGPANAGIESGPTLQTRKCAVAARVSSTRFNLPVHPPRNFQVVRHLLLSYLREKREKREKPPINALKALNAQQLQQTRPLSAVRLSVLFLFRRDCVPAVQPMLLRYGTSFCAH